MSELRFPEIAKRVTIEEAYEAGRDCAINGANVRNCRFSIFATPEHTAAWERGKRDAARATGKD